MDVNTKVDEPNRVTRCEPVNKIGKGKRIEWIDHAKALGILLVVAGHIQSTLLLIPWLYSFHMPLFFFLTGLTFKPTNANREGVKKISKRLIYPYLTYSVITILAMLLTAPILGPLFGDFSYHKLLGILVQLRGSQYTIGLWFLPLLLVSELMLLMILRQVRNKIVEISLVAVILAAGLWYSYCMLPKLPWAIDAALIAMPFIYLGMTMRETVKKWTEFTILKSIAMCLVFISLNVLFCWLNTNNDARTDMWKSTYGNPIYFLLGALFGILFVVSLVTGIMNRMKIRWLGYVGRNTLHIYCAHVALVFPVVAIIFSILHIKYDGGNAWHYVLYFVLAIALCVILVLFIDFARPYKEKILNRILKMREK